MKRKGLLAFIVIAIIAVVLAIVFINLFSDKDTKALAQEINRVATTSYLNEESSEFKEIDEYLTVVSGALDSKEKNEVLNYQNMLKSTAIMIDFYNRQILFSEFSEAYKVERKKIEKEFKKAQEVAEEFCAYIVKNKTDAYGSDWWTANTWVEGKKFMQEITTNANSAFERLQSVFVEGVDSKIINNDLTQLVFNETTKMFSEVNESLSENDLKSTALLNFVEIYYSLNGEKILIAYNYSESMQNEVSDINENGEDSLFYNNLLDGSIAV